MHQLSSASKLFPYKELKRVEKGDLISTLNNAIKNILEMAPDLKCELLNYFVNMAFADGILDEKELALIYDFGDNNRNCEIFKKAIWKRGI